MKSFQIKISDKEINSLKQRIENTRWINEVSATGWGGPSLDVASVKTLTDYWKDKFDWKKQERYINSFPQYTAMVNDLNLHFVYQKGNGKTPVVLLHGWGSNFTEFLSTAELIKKKNADIDVIIPSLPGFGFSDTPGSMSSDSTATYIHTLMTNVLGYKTYHVHGGDYGSFVAEKLASKFPEAVKGIHLSDIPFYHMYAATENLTEKETAFMQKINDWSMADGAYAMIQATKSKTLATALNDSPVGLAAWFTQLYFDFGDKQIPVSQRYTNEQLLTNISIYWYTQTIYSSIRIYSEDMSGFDGNPLPVINVPVGFNFHQHDISGIPPKEFANRFFSNIKSWTEVNEGGHFSGITHPQQLTDDLLTFINRVEKESK